MSERSRWRKAIIWSCAIHVLGLVAACLWLHQLPVANGEHDDIELELVNDIFSTASAVALPELQPPAVSDQIVTGVTATGATLLQGAVTDMAETATSVGNRDDDVVVAVGRTAGPQLAVGSAPGQVRGNGQTASPAPVMSSIEPPKPQEIIPPRVLQAVLPDYPVVARDQGIEGTVLVRVQVLTNGGVGDVTILTSSGNADLDDAAIQAVRRYRFVPARYEQSGEAVTSRIKIPIQFRLND